MATLAPEESLPTRSSETHRGVLALKAAANSAGVVTQSYWLRSCAETKNIFGEKKPESGRGRLRLRERRERE